MRAAPALAALGWAVLGLLATGCADQAPDSAAQAERGRQAIVRTGCGGCHDIPGVTGSVSGVGPSLADMGRRVYIAGVLPNTRAAMVRWLRSPQSVIPGNAMPDMGLGEADAQAMTAYLESLK